MRLLATAFLAAFSLSSAALAQGSCEGRDLLTELRLRETATMQAIEREASAIPFAAGKFFRIEKQGVKPSYLFGTMHSADPRVTAISPAVRRALQGARVAAFELPETGRSEEEAFMSLGPKLVTLIGAKPGERSSDLLAPEEFERFTRVVESTGLPAEAVTELKPTFLAMMASQAPCSVAGGKTPVLDAQLAHLARKARVKVVALETLEEQLAAVGEFSADDQRGILRSFLPALERREDVLETTIQRYLSGEIGFLMAWSWHPGALPGLTTDPLPPSFKSRLFDERNVRMQERALPHVAKGSAFIAVGAAHIPGESGLARLFEKAGYRVERIE